MCLSSPSSRRVAVLQVILKCSPSGSIETPKSRVVVSPSSPLMVLPRNSPKNGSIDIVPDGAGVAPQTPRSNSSAPIADRNVRRACGEDVLGARTPAFSRLGGFAAQPDLLRELRPPLGVSRRDHRIVGGQTPLRPVLVRRHVVGRPQVTFQHLQFLAVFQADDVVAGH